MVKTNIKAYIESPRSVKRDYNIAVKVIQSDYRVYPHLIKKFKLDGKICSMVLIKNFNYFHNKITSVKLAKLLVNMSPRIYYGLPEKFIKNEEVAMIYLYHDCNLSKFISAWNGNITSDKVLNVILKFYPSIYRFLTYEQKCNLLFLESILSTDYASDYHRYIPDEVIGTKEFRSLVHRHFIQNYNLLEDKYKSSVYVLSRLLHYTRNCIPTINIVGELRILAVQIKDNCTWLYVLPKKLKFNRVAELLKYVKSQHKFYSGHGLDFVNYGDHDCMFNFTE